MRHAGCGQDAQSAYYVFAGFAGEALCADKTEIVAAGDS